MNPRDRVLVGCINRKKDFIHARDNHWYRIPEGRAKKGIDAEYIGFFFSRAFGEQNGAIHYYAQNNGHELATRAQLMPDEAKHRRAANHYTVLKLGPLQVKSPPIVNVTRRRLSFIYTTWDRFSKATTIDDLYSRDDGLVDRIFYALEDIGYRPKRRWELEGSYPSTTGAQVRVLCEKGEVVASTLMGEGILITEDVDAAVTTIKQAVQDHGGPQILPVPLD